MAYAIKFNGYFVESGLPWTLHPEPTDECVYSTMEELLKDIDRLSYKSGTAEDQARKGWISLPHGKVEVVRLEKTWRTVEVL